MCRDPVGLAIIGHFSSRLVPFLLPADACPGLSTHFGHTTHRLEGAPMKQHLAPHLNPRPWEWNEIRALILTFILPIVFALAMIIICHRSLLFAAATQQRCAPQEETTSGLKSQ
jgi:hypothetical protein